MRSLVAAALLLAAPETRAPVVAAVVAGGDRGAIARAVRDGGGDVAWGAVVIHHSARAEGSAEAMDRYQREVLRDAVGLVHHFVIGNGSGSPDGAVEVTGPWSRGVQTPHLFRKGDLPPSVSVAVVGDLEASPPTRAQTAALANVIAALVERFDIPIERVLTHREVEGRGTSCPGRNLGKIDVLAAAGLTPRGPARVRVESATGRVSLLIGERVVQRLVRAGGGGPPLPSGIWPVCRRDEGGAFGRTVVIAYPGAAEVASAREGGRITPEESKRLSRALAAGECPPDDTALGGEIGFHAAPPVEEGTACVPLDAADADALFRHALPGTPVEVVP